MAKFLSVADMLQIVLADSSQICHRAVVHICSICQFGKGCKHFKDVLESECEKLKSQDGEFELMREELGGTSRTLKLILIPSSG